jgi:hypothetical protein
MENNESNPTAISICLNCYVIRFKEKRKKNMKFFNDVFGTTELNVMMQRFIKTIDTKLVFKNKKKDRILYLSKTLSASNSESVYAGIIMKGHNGTETYIDEIVGGEIKNVGTVSKDQYNCLPYFFMLYLNKKNPDSLILIAQSYRQYGFKEVFEEAFKNYTQTESTDTTVIFNTLSIASLFEQYIVAGKIDKMRFIKHGLFKGAENVLKGDKFEDYDYETEMSIKSKNGFWGIKKSLKYDNASFIEQVQIDGFEFDEAFADVYVAGRKRIMNVTKPSNFSAAFDITSDVKINSKTNLPDFVDILKQSNDILKNDLIPYL